MYITLLCLLPCIHQPSLASTPAGVMVDCFAEICFFFARYSIGLAICDGGNTEPEGSRTT